MDEFVTEVAKVRDSSSEMNAAKIKNLIYETLVSVCVEGRGQDSAVAVSAAALKHPSELKLVLASLPENNPTRQAGLDAADFCMSLLQGQNLVHQCHKLVPHKFGTEIVRQLKQTVDGLSIDQKMTCCKLMDMLRTSDQGIRLTGEAVADCVTAVKETSESLLKAWLKDKDSRVIVLITSNLYLIIIVLYFILLHPILSIKR